MTFDKYPAISRHPKGSFGWAMDQLNAGNHVRRMNWPIEVTKAGTTVPGGDGGPDYLVVEDRVEVWKLYRPHGCGVCKGFNAGVVGADNDAVGDLGIDSAGYMPAQPDIEALDWQTVDEVTQDQIAFLDRHRLPHVPYGGAQAYYPDATDRKINRMFAGTFGLIAGVAIAVLWVILRR